jgi:nucleoid DNA-binding protein
MIQINFKEALEMARTKNVHISELIRKIGLHALVCPKCGAKLDASGAAKKIFGLILEICKERAEEGVGVTINGFGVFRAKWLRSREIKTPLNGIVQSKGGYVIRFKPSQVAKRRLND